MSTNSELENQLYIILSNYSDDLNAVKKREGMLPAQYAVQAIEQLLDEARINELEQLKNSIGDWDGTIDYRIAELQAKLNKERVDE